MEKILRDTNYDADKTEFLVRGFSEGFTLGYEGPLDMKLQSPNLRFQDGVGSELEMWNKIMKEVEAKRYAGPYDEIPFDDYFIQSPIGLVPKDGGKNTRLIFHLSHTRNSEKILSVNGNTPKEMCQVKYPDFAKAIQLCLKAGKGCKCSKSDWKSAFRHFPILKRFWNLLVMKARDPESQKWFYFVDKCMPFGSSISCSHFQAFSNAIAHVMRIKSGQHNVNYLDDFLFIALMRWLCNQQTEMFLEICDLIRFLVAMEKTVWATTLITFLGMLIDTQKQLILIPQDKICKALRQIEEIMGNKKRKTTVLKIQKICGLLNFLCRALVPGRPFTMQLYRSLAGANRKLKPHHHIKVTESIIQDLGVWKCFLLSPAAYCRPFIDLSEGCTVKTLDWYTDAAKGIGRGMGGHHYSHWFYMFWNKVFLTEKNPSIEYLELFAVTTSVVLWRNLHKNTRIMLFCDNESVVHMINNQSSKCVNCMTLIRILTLQSITDNIRVYARHVRTHLNEKADALSRGDLGRFFKVAEQEGLKMDNYPAEIPEVMENALEKWAEV